MDSLRQQPDYKDFESWYAGTISSPTFSPQRLLHYESI
jgi:hypothetical protein